MKLLQTLTFLKSSNINLYLVNRSSFNGYRRHYASNSVYSGDSKSMSKASSIQDSERRLLNHAKQTLADRDFFLNVLSSTATKREAKSYLSRFSPKQRSPRENVLSCRPEVNLGGLFGPTRAVNESPVFEQSHGRQTRTDSQVEAKHVALIVLRSPEEIGNSTLRGIGNTVSQLNRLGMNTAIVLDCDKGQHISEDWKKDFSSQAERVADAIDSTPGSYSRILDSVIGKFSDANDRRIQHRVISRNLLLRPLRRGVIPIIVPIGYTSDTLTAIPVDANDVLLAVTRELTGLCFDSHKGHPPEKVEDTLEIRKQVSLDRLIILDDFGGIPASDRPQGSHVFINLEQEYETIKTELLKMRSKLETKTQREHPLSVEENYNVPSLDSSNPISKLIKMELPMTGSLWHLIQDPRALRAIDHHLRNLDVLQKALTLLPPSSSALVTTPHEAANSGRPPSSHAQSGLLAVGTRRYRNPLIHNLLTDKPVFSSSLPLGRLGSGDTNKKAIQAMKSPQGTHTTFVKRGMPVTIIPDPRIHTWIAPKPGEPGLDLKDSQLDLPRLVHLIEDSFGRKLDVEHYLNRIKGHIAGLIIAGEYEGGALLTWEVPPGVPKDGSEASRARMVPYLDKFTVLKRSQGAGGVADIVFKAMVKDCFPHGVCWRSRRDNPVNKWYFERAKGTWKISKSNWTMFWTTPSVMEKGQTFMDYEGVCRAVVPSWADNKSIVD
ncbi:MAG: Amino-acid acetyltransferase, mitochondrial [Cirrosporium novae-zelandiae]|nr:MAG: Amino-acid acetyltransferase, mitochondrial [Cirrosporium novae-zelandiae]